MIEISIAMFVIYLIDAALIGAGVVLSIMSIIYVKRLSKRIKNMDEIIAAKERKAEEKSEEVDKRRKEIEEYLDYSYLWKGFRELSKLTVAQKVEILNQLKEDGIISDDEYKELAKGLMNIDEKDSNERD